MMKTKAATLLYGLFAGIAFGVALTLIGQRLLEPTPTWRTGVFSTMEYIEEAGDVSGTEIHILYGGCYWVLFQDAYGEPCAPSLVQADITEDHRITFTAPGLGDTPVCYTGTIKPEALYLHAVIDGQGTDMVLPRTSGYWD